MFSKEWRRAVSIIWSTFVWVLPHPSSWFKMPRKPEQKYQVTFCTLKLQTSGPLWPRYSEVRCQNISLIGSGILYQDMLITVLLVLLMVWVWCYWYKNLMWRRRWNTRYDDHLCDGAAHHVELRLWLIRLSLCFDSLA